METCGEQQRCHLRVAAIMDGRGFLPSPALPRFPKMPRGGGERDTHLPGNAGWLESLKVCGDAKEVAAETAASLGTPPNAGDSPTCQLQPGCHQSILRFLQAGRGHWGPSHQHVRHGDCGDTHIAIVVDYAARWPRGPWGAWGTLWGSRRFVKVLQSGQSPPWRGTTSP